MTGPDQDSTSEPVPDPADVPTLCQCRAHILNRNLLPETIEKGAETPAQNRAESPLKNGLYQNFNLLKNNRT